MVLFRSFNYCSFDYNLHSQTGCRHNIWALDVSCPPSLDRWEEGCEWVLRHMTVAEGWKPGLYSRKAASELGISKATVEQAGNTVWLWTGLWSWLPDQPGPWESGKLGARFFNPLPISARFYRLHAHNTQRRLILPVTRSMTLLYKLHFYCNLHTPSCQDKVPLTGFSNSKQFGGGVCGGVGCGRKHVQHRGSLCRGNFHLQ